jgi:hypothetical protein
MTFIRSDVIERASSSAVPTVIGNNESIGALVIRFQNLSGSLRFPQRAFILGLLHVSFQPSASTNSADKQESGTLCAAFPDMAHIREESPTLDELAAESQRIQDLAAKLLFQIDEILQEIAHRKAVEAHINEGGPDVNG